MADNEAELIKWWDALDMVSNRMYLTPEMEPELDKGLAMARQCRHPDAQYLCSLFPPSRSVTFNRFLAVLKAQGEDARTLYLRWMMLRDTTGEDVSVLRRAADKGYGPALAELCWRFMGERHHNAGRSDAVRRAGRGLR